MRTRGRERFIVRLAGSSSFSARNGKQEATTIDAARTQPRADDLGDKGKNGRKKSRQLSPDQQARDIYSGIDLVARAFLRPLASTSRHSRYVQFRLL